MSNVAPAAIMVASFVLAIGLVRVLDRMIDRDTDPGMADARALARPRLGSARSADPDRTTRPRAAPDRSGEGSTRMCRTPSGASMSLSAWPSRRTHRRDEPIVSSSDASVVNARPTRSPVRSRPVCKARFPVLLSRTGTKNVSAIRTTRPQPNSLRSTADAAAGIARGGAASGDICLVQVSREAWSASDSITTGLAMGIAFRHFAAESDWRDEALRTNLWLIPVAESVAAVLLFVLTLSIDRAASHGELTLPSWVISGSPDAARQILSSLAAAIITVVGVVFSIMIVTLTLASSQFGPRMLRTFIRDRGTQLTLGTFVATFFYAMLTLISIGATFVPHLSVTIALALTAVDLGVLIYFIHHIATVIQLPEVIASIARDLAQAIDAEADAPAGWSGIGNGAAPDVLRARLDRDGRVVTAPASGYLRFVRHVTLVRIAAEYDAVIRLQHRPGHFLTHGHAMATCGRPRSATRSAAAA